MVRGEIGQTQIVHAVESTKIFIKLLNLIYISLISKISPWAWLTI